MKLCFRCKISKLYSEFNRQHNRKDGLTWACKTCISILRKENYKKHRNRRIRENSESKARRKDLALKFIIEYLLQNPCVDCGESDPLVLEFDHVRGNKLDNISTLIIGNRSLEIVKLEIEKCEVRCANCHKRRTARTGNFARYAMLIKRHNIGLPSRSQAFESPT